MTFCIWLREMNEVKNSPQQELNAVNLGNVTRNMVTEHVNCACVGAGIGMAYARI